MTINNTLSVTYVINNKKNNNNIDRDDPIFLFIEEFIRIKSYICTKNISICLSKQLYVNYDDIILIIGCGAGGKTSVAKSILNKFPASFITHSVIINNSELTYPEYSEYNCNILYNYNYDSIKDYLHNDSNGIILLDNCLSNYDLKQIPTTPIFNKSNKLRIITAQYITDVDDIIDKIGYIFLLREEYYMRQRELFQMFGSCFPSFDAFKRTYKNYTKDDMCMVINNKINSNDISKKIICYKF